MNRRDLGFTPRARREYLNVPERERGAIDRELDRLCTNPSQVDIRKLQGVPGEYRLRVGSWRVRFSFNRPEHRVEVLRIDQRKDAYR